MGEGANAGCFSDSKGAKRETRAAREGFFAFQFREQIVTCSVTVMVLSPLAHAVSCAIPFFSMSFAGTCSSSAARSASASALPLAPRDARASLQAKAPGSTRHRLAGAFLRPSRSAPGLACAVMRAHTKRTPERLLQDTRTGSAGAHRANSCCPWLGRPTHRHSILAR